MGRLLFLFVAVPIVELMLLIEIGQRVGTLTTLGLVIVTGIVGASLARQQGMSTLARVRRDLNEGRLPAESLVEGVLILVAGAVLITPGVLTDLVGLLCLVPACRRRLTRYLKRKLEHAVQTGTINMTTGFGGARHVRRPIKNVTPRRPNAPGT